MQSLEELMSVANDVFANYSEQEKNRWHQQVLIRICQRLNERPQVVVVGTESTTRQAFKYFKDVIAPLCALGSLVVSIIAVSRQH